MLWLGCLRTTTVVGTHGLDRFHDERKMYCNTKHENRRSLYCSSFSHQKSVSADDKSKHNKRPALHHQNQLPDSGSVHEAQLRQLWLSLHRSHRHTYFVCFCLECFTIFRGEKRRSLYCSSSSHQKFVSADDKSKHKPSPSSPEPIS